MENKRRNLHGKHGIMMLLGCLLPIALIAALPFLGIRIGSISNLLFLLCPLMHIGMMIFMNKSSDKQSCHEKN